MDIVQTGGVILFKNVYIVEQSSPLRVMLKTMFRAGGFPVTEALEKIPSLQDIGFEYSWLIVHLTDDNQSELLKFLEEVPLSGKKIEVSVILAKKDREFFPLIASRGLLVFLNFLLLVKV